MTESSTESALGTWSALECPYTIEYSPRVLDDIRLAVVDAFYSLPRGGAEIGGILLGRFADGRVSILEYQALDCEHAMGPSFTLSPNDLTQLADLLAAAQQHPDGMRPVGWYHSHTRSDIFLSDADQDLHKRFFPEPWQVALVLKPSTFEPTRGGFFFREADGSIRGSASYQEFVVEAQPIRQVPSGAAPQMPPAPQPLRREADVSGPVITLVPEAQPEPAPQPVPQVAPEPVAQAAPAQEQAAEPEHESLDLPAPQFLQIKPDRSWRSLKIVAALALGAGLGSAAFETRQVWLPPMLEKVSPMMARIRPRLPNEAPPTVALGAADDNGQLRIHWDGKSPAIQKAGEGVLEIIDGAAPVQSIPLDQTHLEAGAFTYSRQAERVEVRLAIGDQVKEVASFLGKLPEHKLPPEDPAVRKERDDLRQQAAKLKGDLEFQAAKTRRLEKALNDVKEQLEKESQRRLANQLPDPVKK
ncbi:MAG: Mov34/MPN/PAD-1 family protein [Bryobacteraceae bacterium]|jgi:proteasome lid subunit RPN8/RPN11